jgi:nicotinamidase-related amidase
MFTRLRKETISFLMVDLQERLLSSIAGRVSLTRNVVRLLTAADVLSLPVLYTEQNPKGIGPTAGDLVRALPKNARRFEKMAFSCCDEPGFLEIFHEDMFLASSVTVVFGIETHICVLGTVQDMLGRRRKVVVASDACGSRNQADHELALAAAQFCGAFVVPTETVVYHLLEKAGTAAFKALLPLFK